MPPKRKPDFAPKPDAFDLGDSSVNAVNAAIAAIEAEPHAVLMASDSIEPKRLKISDLAVPTWNDMLFEILHYKAIHGDFKIKGKDTHHKRLQEWMAQQRKAFKSFQENPQRSTLTEEQVRVLDSVQFPWNTRGDEHWSRNYEHLKDFREKNGHTMVPRTYQEVPNLCHWVTDQRRQLKNHNKGLQSNLTKERKRLLDEIGFVWQVRNRTTWDVRYQELVEFKEKRGTTIVPQHFAENRALGKWVAKQREQYKLRSKGEHSFLTPDRLDLLNSIGFVWSVKGHTKVEDDVDTKIHPEMVAGPEPLPANVHDVAMALAPIPHHPHGV